METKIFLNLPVKDLNKSVEFFTRLGFTFDPKFTNASATCMNVGRDSFVMLLVEEFFQTFTKKAIADTSKTTEILIAIAAESRQAVDQIIEKAREAGGKIYEKNDQGFMYTNDFEDPDGHIWEVFYMDEAAFAAAAESEAGN
jgi:predicted lactoylglutathione lyase